MIRLFTSCYPEKDPARRAELTYSLEKNLSSSTLDAVYVFLEGIETAWSISPRLNAMPILHRPRYSDFFGWANELRGSDDDVAIIANSDIFFDSSLTILAERLKPNQCVALSRWDLHSDGHSKLFDRNDSQDVWVFKGRIRPVVADFCVGIPRCDNRILHELRAVGYEVINPAFSVRAFHLHEGERAEYSAQIEGLHVDPPYAYLWPHNLYSLPATVIHRLCHPDSTLGWRFDWRKLQRTVLCRVWKKVKRQLTVSSRQ